MLAVEEDAGRADRVQAEEPAGRHEREREEQDAGVAAPLSGLAGRVPEREREAAEGAEDEEVRAVVLEVRVELRAEEERREADERQRCGDRPQRDCGNRMAQE